MPSEALMTDSGPNRSGRGILLDYAEWASSQSPPITYSTFSTHSIPFTTLLAICKYHDVTPRKGDILFIRTGVISEWNSFSDQQKQDYAAQKEPKHAGIEACLETLEWLWNSGISAVAGDAISWEVSASLLILGPESANGYQVYPTPGEISMHEYLLGGWGCPIGKFQSPV